MKTRRSFLKDTGALAIGSILLIRLLVGND